MSAERTYFPFYWNWGEMIETIAISKPEMAQELSYAIIHYAMTQEVIEFSDPLVEAMFRGSITIGIDSAVKNYGKNGKFKEDGASRIEFTPEQIIGAYQKCGAWTAAAGYLSVDPKTLRRIRIELGIDKKGKMGKTGMDFPENSSPENPEIPEIDEQEREKWEKGEKQKEEEFFPIFNPISLRTKELEEQGFDAITAQRSAKLGF